MNNKILEYIAENLELDIYDAICELQNLWNERERLDFPEREVPNLSRNEKVKNWIEDCLNELGAKDDNIKDLDIDEIEEPISQYADTNTEIYNYKLWRHAPILSGFIEEMIDQYGLINEGKIDLIKIFQQGEYYFYEKFARNVVDLLQQYIEEEMENED